METTLPPVDYTCPAYFPVTFPMREKQAKAVSFLHRAIVDKGYRDIVIEAPTGIGKSLIGAAACHWAANSPLAAPLEGDPGGYYLVTQKMLQDQLEGDFEHFKMDYRLNSHLLKSATDYECLQFGNCMVGRKMKSGKAPACTAHREKVCTYSLARQRFIRAHMAITNYPFFFTERTFIGQFPKKKVLIADECHTLERQILGFIEMGITAENLKEWAPAVDMPELPDKLDFCDWINEEYLPVVSQMLEAREEVLLASPFDRRAQVEHHKLATHVSRVASSVEAIATQPDNWVYWQERDQFKQITASIAKPLHAGSYVNKLITSMASVRIYMSAYPGPQETFCHLLGLDLKKVAWIGLSSTFPKENRPVIMSLVGSMGQKSIRETTPLLLQKCEEILAKHADEKGVIHCHSYKIGSEIFNHMRSTTFADRVLFARNADERKTVFEEHNTSSEPTVMLSPSMTEGFNLKDDLARFQIIAKMPYPYLGDPQVAAKKDNDPQWYVLQTVMTIIQACGRIVRSETDHGMTYILDADFNRLYEQNKRFFPRWFTDSFVWGAGA